MHAKDRGVKTIVCHQAVSQITDNRFVAGKERTGVVRDDAALDKRLRRKRLVAHILRKFTAQQWSLRA